MPASKEISPNSNNEVENINEDEELVVNEDDEENEGEEESVVGTKSTSDVEDEEKGLEAKIPRKNSEYPDNYLEQPAAHEQSAEEEDQQQEIEPPKKRKKEHLDEYMLPTLVLLKCLVKCVL